MSSGVRLGRVDWRFASLRILGLKPRKSGGAWLGTGVLGGS